MAIEYKKQIVFTKDSTIYGHQSLDEGGFPKDAGNGKLSQVLDMAESQTVDSLKDKITITIDLDDSRLYHFNIDGVSVSTFEIPADRFLKGVTYDDVTKTLTFTFFTGTGEESVSVDLSSLVDTYTAGNGLQLSGGVFSIKVKNTETRLKADSTGLYIDLSDITAKITAEETARQNADTELSGRIDSLSETVSGIETRVDAKVAKAETAATNASNSATSAQASATTASEKATSATNSASRASNSEVNAKASETNAKDSEDNAKASEDNASASEANAKLSETNAKASETNAKASETNAKASEEQAQALVEQVDLNLIESIEQTTASTESSGKNVITITQKDGTKSTFDVYNGAKGEQGPQGEQGEKGDKGDVGTVSQATSSVAGIMKLFTSLGQDTDGAPTNKAVQDAISAISLRMFPIGSIYMCMTDTSPASFIGGEWKKIEDRFLIGASSNYPIGKDGGEASHVLTEAEMPSHNHGNASLQGSLGYVQMMGNVETTGVVTGSSEYSSLNSAYSGNTLKPRKFTLDASHTHNTNGSNKAHNNMPPYTPVYIWQRVS